MLSPPGSSAPTSPGGTGRGWERWNRGNTGRDESNSPGGGEAEREEDPARCLAPAGSCSAISRSSSRVVLCGEDKRHRSERAPPAFPPLFHCRARRGTSPLRAPAGSSREGSGARLWGATNVIPVLNPRRGTGPAAGKEINSLPARSRLQELGAVTTSAVVLRPAPLPCCSSCTRAPHPGGGGVGGRISPRSRRRRSLAAASSCSVSRGKWAARCQQASYGTEQGFNLPGEGRGAGSSRTAGPGTLRSPFCWAPALFCPAGTHSEPGSLPRGAERGRAVSQPQCCRIQPTGGCGCPGVRVHPVPTPTRTVEAPWAPGAVRMLRGSSPGEILELPLGTTRGPDAAP